MFSRIQDLPHSLVLDIVRNIWDVASKQFSKCRTATCDIFNKKMGKNEIDIQM